MGHGLLGTVSVEDLEAVAAGYQFVACFFESNSGLLGKEGKRFFVAVDAVSDEVICGVVSDLQDSVGDGFAQEYKVRRVV